MKANYTHIAVLLDRSGSVSRLVDDFIGGYNSFLKDQQAGEGEATITLVQFDTAYEHIYKEFDIEEATPINRQIYNARGGTSLNDSLAKLITETGNYLKAKKEEDRPSKVMFQIITDGQENASKEFTTTQIKDMITHQETNYSWEFVYIGANQDSFGEAHNYGMSNAMNYAFTNMGVQDMFASMSATTASYRSAPVGTTLKSIMQPDEEKVQ